MSTRDNKNIINARFKLLIEKEHLENRIAEINASLHITWQEAAKIILENVCSYDEDWTLAIGITGNLEKSFVVRRTLTHQHSMKDDYLDSLDTHHGLLKIFNPIFVKNITLKQIFNTRAEYLADRNLKYEVWKPAQEIKK